MENKEESKKAEMELAEIRKQAGDIVSRAIAYQVVSEKTYEDATKVISWIAGAIKRVEALRLFHTKPLHEQVKRENELHKGYAKPFVDARNIMDTKMLSYRREQIDKQAAEQEKIKKEAEKIAKKEGISVDEVMAGVEQKEVPQTVGTATVIKKWVGVVINEDEVERQYCSSDSVKINAGIKLGVRKMKGIQISEKERISTR